MISRERQRLCESGGSKGFLQLISEGDQNCQIPVLAFPAHYSKSWWSMGKCEEHDRVHKAILGLIHAEGKWFRAHTDRY